jgi:hypothetical protein
MQVSFDLISDLHVETWDDLFNWEGMPTSMMAVVAGDVSRDRELLVRALENLTEQYKLVIFVDGNDEHRYGLENLAESYSSLKDELAHLENFYYLQNNVVVIDGIAFLGCNAWWTYDFDNAESYDESKEYFTERYCVSMEAANLVEAQAYQDVKHMLEQVKKLQTHPDVKEIVLVTHTVPDVSLVQHDIDLEGTHLLNCTGNRLINKVFLEDTESKIHTWVFGHYHGDVDQVLHGVRFVNNARGRGNTPWSKNVYNAKKILIEL